MRLFVRFFFAVPVCLALLYLALPLIFFSQAKPLDLRRCHTKKKGKKDPKKIRLFSCMTREGEERGGRVLLGSSFPERRKEVDGRSRAIGLRWVGIILFKHVCLYIRIPTR